MQSPDHSWKLDVRGLGLVVQEWQGAPVDRPPIVCLHGWLDQGLAFGRVAAGRPGRWIALDQRGFGQSDPSGAGGYPHFANYIADVDALITALGGGPVDLVGHSMGGTVASMVAAAAPDRIRRLVIVEGMGALPRWSHGPVEQIRKHLVGLRDLPRVPTADDVPAAASRLRRRHPQLTEAHALALATHGTVPTESGRVRWRFDPLHLTRAAYAFIEANYLDFLAAIEAPTLAIWATESWYPEDIQGLRTAAIPHARTLRLAGGHMLPYDAPDALGDALEDFFCAA